MLPLSLAAQKTAAQTSDSSSDEKKVRDIVTFFQYMLNTLGSSSTSSRDKDVLVTESYAKIFRDAKVQVQDDLDEARDVITNKDVVAYLKDVDFFFKDAKFDFTIEGIEKSTLPNGDLFYKVSTTRNLSGTTTDQEQVNNTLPRYIEVNFNPEDQDLKIVSVYTNEFDEKEALTAWWYQLSYEWQAIFRRSGSSISQGQYGDSLSTSEIKAFTSMTELDLSNNKYIQTIDPLSQLLSLSSLNLSGTTIDDITPIRNLTELQKLDLSNTAVKDISHLKYASRLDSLNMMNTEVDDIAVLEKMPNLRELKMSGTSVSNFSPLSHLTQLKYLDMEGTSISNVSDLGEMAGLVRLNISRTAVQDLSPLINLKNLISFNVDSTRVNDLQTLSAFENLEVLNANYTAIEDLSPLNELSKLERIYCDQTAIRKEQADAFMKTNPEVLVIFDSRDLKAWWETLTPEWQGVFSKNSKIGVTEPSSSPSKEELARITHLDSINLGELPEINTLEPLQKLQNLKSVNVGYTHVSDLSPLEGCKELEFLDISGTGVKDISMLTRFPRLQTVVADKSEIKNIDYYSLPALRVLYADHTTVHDFIAKDFLRKNPECLLIYKTIHLNRWWGNLNENWKEVFRKSLPDLGPASVGASERGPTRENLHRLIEQETLQFNDAYVSELTALSEFVRLKHLHFSGTAITGIPPLENIRSLQSLHATNSPLAEIESLRLLTNLEDVDISNSPVSDLGPLSELVNLKKLNCSGTQIKRLNELEHLANLESLDCSNTRVRKLEPLGVIPLNALKCYNTRISPREIEYFMATHPNCAVVYY
jgi:Leucine-rich repeat (LRR) protein